LTRDGVIERIWDATEEHANHMHVWQICQRAKDLVRRGFTLKGPLMTPLMELKLMGHSAIEDACYNLEDDVKVIQARRSTQEVMKCLNREGISLPKDIYELIENY
jgi:hypothetical protein